MKYITCESQHFFALIRKLWTVRETLIQRWILNNRDISKYHYFLGDFSSFRRVQPVLLNLWPRYQSKVDDKVRNVLENSEMVRVNRNNKAYGSHGPRTPSQPDESMLESCTANFTCKNTLRWNAASVAISRSFLCPVASTYRKIGWCCLVSL